VLSRCRSFLIAVAAVQSADIGRGTRVAAAVLFPAGVAKGGESCETGKVLVLVGEFLCMQKVNNQPEINRNGNVLPVPVPGKHIPFRQFG